MCQITSLNRGLFAKNLRFLIRKWLVKISRIRSTTHYIISPKGLTLIKKSLKTDSGRNASTNNSPDKKSDVSYIKTGESEIDSLVVEELFSSSEFQSWFLKKMGIEGPYEFIGAWKSYPGEYGECDIVAKFSVAKQRIVILVENKIYSPEQPDQADRYHKTGKYLEENENWDRHVTCLLSPERYSREDASRGKYDCKISYEELLEWFEKQRASERIRFKQMVIENGIERAITGYVKSTDENTNRFYHYYKELARQIQPELEYHIPKGKPASGSLWLYFTPEILSKKAKIIHKGREGYVDLQISGIDIDEFSKLYKNELNDHNMTSHKTGKSVSIRKMVPVMPDIENVEEPERYREEIVEALQAAGKLRNWYLEFYQK
jgi:hypothetical protein